MTSKVLAGEAKEAQPVLIKLVKEVAKINTQIVLKQPISLIPLNMVLRKLSSTSIDTVESVVMKMIDKVFAKLTPEEYVTFVTYFNAFSIYGENKDQLIEDGLKHRVNYQ